MTQKPLPSTTTLMQFVEKQGKFACNIKSTIKGVHHVRFTRAEGWLVASTTQVLAKVMTRDALLNFITVNGMDLLEFKHYLKLAIATAGVFYIDKYIECTDLVGEEAIDILMAQRAEQREKLEDTEVLDNVLPFRKLTLVPDLEDGNEKA